MSHYTEIDGSALEGGGQILRMSVAFSAIMGIPVRVSNIRAGRSKPGLAAQHCKGIELVGQMCQAKLRGAQIGSTEIEFTPGKIRGGQYTADTQTAGSISLLLQVSLPCALLADEAVSLQLIGGTNADMAPQVDFLSEVFRPVLEKFGATFDFELHRRGYFPRGGGRVSVEVTPVRNLRSVTMTDPGRVEKVYGWSFVAGTLPLKLSHQMSSGAQQELRTISNNINIECYKEDRNIAPDNCNGIIIVSETSTGCILGGDGLGKRGVDPYAVGSDAARGLRLAVESGACVDQHTQDQIIIFMALAEGKSSVQVGEITLHTKTAMHIAKTIAKVKFNVIPNGPNNIIECVGLGFLNRNVPVR